jgi:hypothetical protein
MGNVMGLMVVVLARRIGPTAVAWQLLLYVE